MVYRSGRAARIAGLRGLLDGRAISVAAFDSGALCAAAARLRGADAVLAFSSVMAPYAPAAEGRPRVMDFVDADSEKWRDYAARSAGPAAWIYAREADRLGRFETAVASSWDQSLFVCEREARVIRARAPGAAVGVIVNGIDTEFFAPRPRGRRRGTDPPLRNRPGRGCLHGHDGLLPERRRRALVRGRDLPARPRGAPRRPLLDRRPQPVPRREGTLLRPGIEVTGSVPDVRDHLAEADLAVAPLRVARGLQNKVLEAMAMALPVVATTAVFEGLDAPGDVGIEVADDPADFASRVITLLREENRRIEAGRRAAPTSRGAIGGPTTARRSKRSSRASSPRARGPVRGPVPEEAVS